MPVLRYQDVEGKSVEVVLDLSEGGDGKAPPVTIGSAPESASHLHLPGGSLQPNQARIIGSRASRAYAFVIGGRGVYINGRDIEGIRVLRHGDCVRLGTTNLVYLDFAIRKLNKDSRLAGKKCSLSGCQDLLTTEDWKDEVITCPWCSAAFHATCWLQSERCNSRDCYPIQRVLLAELAGEVKLERADDRLTLINRWCAARCSRGRLIEPGEMVIRCPNASCGAPYHPGCWLSLRAPCLECAVETADVPRLMDKFVFRRPESAQR